MATKHIQIVGKKPILNIFRKEEFYEGIRKIRGVKKILKIS